jgi:hypothetical protein
MEGRAVLPGTNEPTIAPTPSIQPAANKVKYYPYTKKMKFHFL